MMRAAIAMGLALVAVTPTVAQAQALTPTGPATMRIGYGPNVACPAIGTFPTVLVKWQVNVGAGGSSGTVRPVFGDVLGDPVTLPAEPGTYTFPAPHIPWFECLNNPKLIQETGGHAIVAAEDTPLGRFIAVQRDGQTDERIEQSYLSVSALTEPDRDSDRRGDRTEDRTDLTVTAAPTRDAIGRLKVSLTVTNAGPLPADAPLLTATGVGKPRWISGCRHVPGVNLCMLDALAVGESRAVVLHDDAPGTQNAGFALTAEGPDLNALNNQALFTFAPAQAFDLTAPSHQRLKNGIRLTILGATQQQARITVAIKARGRTIKLVRTVRLAALVDRTLTIRPAGTKLRALRTALTSRPVRAHITVSTLAGKTPVTVATKLTR